MSTTFFFYDLETSGFSPREARIMQFAGQRTDMSLRPIGAPLNYFLRLSEDILPDPEAVLLTGITPQKTQEHGSREAAFLKVFHEQIATTGTIFVGFNNIRFDDEFMRFLHYRNFYDAYAWQWKDGRSRWDLLDVVRMTRALRPEGIVWPFDKENRPTNRLDLLAQTNHLDHTSAHDASSDVKATIALARLLQEQQPKIFHFLLNHRSRQDVAALVGDGHAFLYTSGKYPGEFEKTTIVTAVADHPQKSGVLVYDLRHDPDIFAHFSEKQLAAAWQWQGDSEGIHLPVKTLQFNRCPAIAPLSVLDSPSINRLKIDLKHIQEHQKRLEKMTDFPKRLLGALKILDQAREKAGASESSVDAQLYDGFFGNQDQKRMATVQHVDSGNVFLNNLSFHDPRLNKLLPLFIARNYPQSMNKEQAMNWKLYRYHALLDGGDHSHLARYRLRLNEIMTNQQLTKKQKALLDDLERWGQAITSDLGVDLDPGEPTKQIPTQSNMFE